MLVDPSLVAPCRHGIWCRGALGVAGPGVASPRRRVSRPDDPAVRNPAAPGRAYDRPLCAAILPAPPGSGKSTLCAALVNRGWRLLSDELTLIRLDTGEIMGLARPVNLKNASIDIIRAYAPDAFLTQPVRDTTKGTVALMAPTRASVEAVGEWADPAWMVLPRYRAGTDAVLTPMGSGAAFMQLADNAMNYHVLGPKGFDTVGRVIDNCRNYSFEYSRLDDAIAVFDRLAAGAGGDAP